VVGRLAQEPPVLYEIGVTGVLPHLTDRQAQMALATRVLLVLASAAVYGLSFPPAGFHLFAWCALVPLLLALRGATFGEACFLGWLSGIAIAYAVTDFLPPAITVYYNQTTLFGFVLFVVIVSIMCCPGLVAFSLCVRTLSDPGGALRPLVVAAAWAAAELMRGRLGGNPWGTLGYTQAPVPSVIQIAELTGVYGVSFVLAAVNAAIAQALTQAARPQRVWRSAIAGVAGAAGLALLTVGFGLARLSGAAKPQGSPAVRLAIVQGNIDLGSQWRSDMYGRNLEIYLRLTMQAARDAHPLLVVWPENAMTFFIDEEPLYRAAIGRVLSSAGVELISGGPRELDSTHRRFFNSAFLISPTGEIRARYDKQFLVPFAEYFPLASIEFLNRRFGRIRQFTSGGRTPPLASVAGRAGIVICNEALFPEVVGDRVRAGADYIVNLANDSWLGDRRYSARILDVAVFRAVEQRRYLVRASTSGTSAIVDPWGRVTARAELFTEAVVTGDIRRHSTITTYNRLGDLFGALCAAAALSAALMPFLRGRTRLRVSLNARLRQGQAR